MPLHPSPRRIPGSGPRLGVKEAEAAVVEHYPRLVRLAYLTLPPALGRHRRVLAAHAVVQRALYGGLPAAPRQVEGTVPAPRAEGSRSDRGGPRSPAYAGVRLRVLRSALAYDARPPWWPVRWPAPAALRPSAPVVRGLRLFPRAGGTEEFALDRAVAGVTGPARAALGLLLLEALPADGTRALLAEAGVTDPAEAVRVAGQVAGSDHDRVRTLLGSAEFDPCTVQTRPSDLLRRRNRRRGGVAVVALCAVAGGLGLTAGAGADDSRQPASAPRASVTGGQAAAAALVRTPAGQWADTSRVDFSAWPPRGTRTDDEALLGRALGAWTRPSADAVVTTAPGAVGVPPVQPPRLLFAGDVGGEGVVLFHDGGVRVVRYAEPLSGEGAPALDFARADDADVTTAAAVAVSRSDGAARYLLAPWIAESATRDLLAPGAPARPLAVDGNGVTAAVAPPASGGCRSWPVMQLRSSEKIVEKHAFLLTDLGDLSPVHLTHTPKPGSGAPARQPREATGTDALAGWARTACSLQDLRGSGVRAVNHWQFAEQPLPGTRTTAGWVCTRADTWRGQGRVLVQFVPPAKSPTAPVRTVADRRNTALCSRFGQHVVAGTHWRSPTGAWYVLAAGSRAVTGIEVTGPVRAAAGGRTLAVRAPRDAGFRVEAKLPDGGTLPSVR